MNTYFKKDIQPTVQFNFEDCLPFFQELNQGIIITDGGGRILLCNQKYLEICCFNSLGLGCEDVVGLHIHELLAIGRIARNESAIVRCLERKNKIIGIMKSALYKVILSTAIPVFRQDGDIKLIFTIVQDEKTIFHLLSASDESAHDDVRKMYNQYLRENGRELTENFISVSGSMLQIAYQCYKISSSELTVLLLGESGVGKEMIARLIHKNSNRSGKPFIALNCGAITESLIESELFGYAPGAFTGAHKCGKPGIFEAADSGTILLDEIGDMPLPVQVKLLRVLEERQVTRVGSVRPAPVDFRLICATNQNLLEKVNSGEFRKDLYYRINVCRVHIPPLRERREDIPTLILHFLSLYNLKYKLNKKIADGVMHEFTHYDWPGNIRELKNVMEQLVALSRGNVINAEQIRSILYADREEGEASAAVMVRRILPIKTAVAEMEKQLLSMVQQVERSSYKAARLLNIDQTTVLRKLKKYGIEGFH